jgi:hypothetical protein
VAFFLGLSGRAIRIEPAPQTGARKDGLPLVEFTAEHD